MSPRRKKPDPKEPGKKSRSETEDAKKLMKLRGEIGKQDPAAVARALKRCMDKS